jgi:hypothetical protein
MVFNDVQIICSLFIGAVSNLGDQTTRNNKPERMRKEAVITQFWFSARHLPRKTDKNHEKIQNSRCPGRDSNRTPPEYKSEPLPLDAIFSVNNV